MPSRAAYAILLGLDLGVASCVQSPESSTKGPRTEEPTSKAPEETGEAAQPAYEDTYHFTVLIADDGKGKGGGWLEASADLKFEEISFVPPYVYEWHCPVIVGMPIRSGGSRISARYAALVAGEVTDEATEEVMNRRKGNWRSLGTEYCQELQELMEAKFKGPPHRIAGARVKRVNPW